MARRERKERKLQLREKWAKINEKKSQQVLDEAHKISEHIPPGQPILKGHHSEKKHRRDIESLNNKMHKSIEHANKAEYHKNKAKNLKRQLDTTIFSDDFDAIEKLKAKIEALINQRKRYREINKAIKTNSPIEMTKIERLELDCWKLTMNYSMFPECKFNNLSSRIRATKKRLERLKNGA